MIPLGGSTSLGNHRYGISPVTTCITPAACIVIPVAEFGRLTVIDGKEAGRQHRSDINSAGATIVNAKLGVRFNYGECQSLYLGYGRAWTGDVWYKGHPPVLSTGFSSRKG